MQVLCAELIGVSASTCAKCEHWYLHDNGDSAIRRPCRHTCAARCSCEHYVHAQRLAVGLHILCAMTVTMSTDGQHCNVDHMHGSHSAMRLDGRLCMASQAVLPVSHHISIVSVIDHLLTISTCMHVRASVVRVPSPKLQSVRDAHDRRMQHAGACRAW
eukprot:TRINITY_DN3051_c0_g1_i1.p1 TRINITY_DN3051_c0_g1~~TRINITY_DN3051_c0_g1_i1.p1  ORF type:complete len:159 (+),score=4.86 TRINITY_DN3051_c0_g1_i1:403-879(+)